jgi:hypothetical protein
MTDQFSILKTTGRLDAAGVAYMLTGSSLPATTPSRA